MISILNIGNLNWSSFCLNNISLIVEIAITDIMNFLQTQFSWFMYFCTTFTYAIKHFSNSCTTILIFNGYINRLTVINVMYRATCLPLITKHIRLSIAKRYIIGSILWGVCVMLWMAMMDISPLFSLHSCTW